MNIYVMIVATSKYWTSIVIVITIIINHPNDCSGNTDRQKLPNIIFIMADDLGYGDLGSYGQRLIQTPNLNKMATQGIKFTNVYAGAPVCAPSRSVLITGQHTGHTTVRNNSGIVGGVGDEMTGEGHRIPLFEEDITVAEVLKKAGYVTGVTGKWGLGENGTTGVPSQQGFDEWYGYLNQNHAVFYYTDYLWHNTQKESIAENDDNQQQIYTHDLFTDFALDFIRRHRDEPFFLYVPYTIPHFNLEVPNLETYTENTDWPESAKIYASMITRMDRDVGRILELLKQLDINKNTLVFFTSDNGPDYSDSGPLKGDSLFNSNGSLNGAKGNLTEGGIRVPMIVSWPGKVKAGKVSNAQWYFADVLPTLAELTGTEYPTNIDGISILPTLLGKMQNYPDDRFMYWEDPPPNLEQAARLGDWKALRLEMDHKIRLYNLANDPHEKHDLASQYPSVVTMFDNYFKTARTESPFWPIE